MYKCMIYQEKKMVYTNDYIYFIKLNLDLWLCLSMTVYIYERLFNKQQLYVK